MQFPIPLAQKETQPEINSNPVPDRVKRKEALKVI